MENVRDLNKICESIKFKQERKSRGGYKYTLNLTLTNGKSTSIYVSEDDFILMQMLKEIYGESIKTRELVEDYSENTENLYTCVKIELADGTIRRYLPSFTFSRVIDLTYEMYLKSQKADKKVTA